MGKSKIFTEEEIKFIKENYKIMSDEQIAEELGRTPGSIKTKRKNLGLIIRNDYWSKDDEQFLKDNCLNMSDEEIGKILGRTASSVKTKRQKFGLVQQLRRFSDDEIRNIIIDYQNGISMKDISEKYDRDECSLYRQIRSWGAFEYKTKQWTKEEIQILKEFYPNSTWNDLLEKLPRFGKEELTHKASKLKIKRECEFSLWSDEDIQWLKDNYSISTPDSLLERFPNRTLPSIRTLASKLGVRTREFWSDDDLELLKKLYPHERDNRKLAELFGRTYDSIINTANNLGLKKEQRSDTDTEIQNKRKIMLADLKDFANELGRTPFISEVNENKNIASEITYRRFFGSYSKACVEAGLIPNYTVFGEHKNVLLSKNNDICLSKNELYITNIFIANNLFYIKDMLYKKIFDNKKYGLKQCDWFINNKTLVEYFGMMEKPYYRVKAENKINICKENKADLICLYPSDIDNNFKGLIDKFNLYGINLLIEDDILKYA